jgi:hypothetical protein
MDVRDSLIHGDDAVREFRTVTMVLGVGVPQPKWRLTMSIADRWQPIKAKKSTAIE